MFLLAPCMAARRLAFSPASDPAQASNSEMNTLLLVQGWHVAVLPPIISDNACASQGGRGLAVYLRTASLRLHFDDDPAVLARVEH